MTCQRQARYGLDNYTRYPSLLRNDDGYDVGDNNNNVDIQTKQQHQISGLWGHYLVEMKEIPNVITPEISC